MRKATPKRGAVPFLAALYVAYLALGMAPSVSRAEAHSTPASPKTSERGRVLHLSFREDIATLDPIAAEDPLSFAVIGALFETLYQYRYLWDHFTTEPLLAADWPKVSQDGMTVTIRIRTDARFRSGKPVTATETADSLNRLLHSTKANQPAGLASEVVSVRAVKDHEIELRLSHPDPRLTEKLAEPSTSITARETSNESGNPVLIGSGPFRLKEWHRGKWILLERSPTYHPDFYPTEASPTFVKQGYLEDQGRLLPLLDMIEIKIIPNQKNAWAAFQDQRQDVLTVTQENFDRIITSSGELDPELAKEGFVLHTEHNPKFFFIAFNLKDPVLGKSAKLRRALAYAVDPSAWVAQFTHHRGQIADSPVPPSIPDRPTPAPESARPHFNLKMAKKLLAEMGHPNGRGLPVFRFDLRSADPVNRKLGEFFATQFAAIGVKVRVVPNSFQNYLEKAKRGSLQISAGGWSLDTPDALDAFRPLLAPEIAASNAKLIALFEEAAKAPAGADRQNLLKKIQDWTDAEAPWILGYYATDDRLLQARVRNFRSVEMIANRLKYWNVAEPKPDQKKLQ